MRTSFTLLFCGSSIIVFAQVSGGEMTFDTPGEPLHLDSVYPAGCWQVGPPNKDVFTSAWSEPNALVTDTVLPHADSTTCYAQFTLVADNVELLGKAIQFQYWSDMDSLQSFGWIEKQNSATYAWNTLPLSDAYFVYFNNSGELATDSGSFFTGRTNGWRTAEIYLECIGVFHDDDQERGGGWSDTMRLRFAFRGAPNSAGFDGWMIDNVVAVPLACSGGVAESGTNTINLFPNPADVSVQLTTAVTGGFVGSLEIIRADGVFVYQQQVNRLRSMDIVTRDLSNGVYLVRLTNGRDQMFSKLVVQH